jgi:hypothetical protein
VRFNGQVGDLVRSPNRLPTDREDTVLGVERVAIQSLVEHAGEDYRSHATPGQLKVATSPLFLEAAERWLAGLDGFDALTVIDLNYLESCIAPWAGPWAYAEYFDPGFTIFPMCHREVVDTFLALPEEDRRGYALQRAVIGDQWPELLQWPFNETPWQVTLRQFQKRALRHARRRTVAATSHLTHKFSAS